LLRATLNWVRNPFLYKAKLLKLIINVLVAIALFWNLGTSNEIDVKDRYGAVYWMVFTPVAESTIGCVLTFLNDKALF